MANIKFHILDVFAPKKYAGNQLAVFFDLEQQLSSDQMLQITREINFAESTFITSIEEDGSFGVRIFTTEYEVPFAGHPTLGTAYMIAKKLLKSPSDKVILRLKKRDIPVHISEPQNIETSRFTMQQAQPDFGVILNSDIVSSALGISSDDIDISMPIEWVNTGLPYLIIFLKDLNVIKKLKLNSDKITKFLRSQKLHKENNSIGLTTSLFFVTKETENKAHHYHSRMFVLENDSLWEDAATGSANGCLLAYLIKNVNSVVTAVVEQGYEMGRESLLYLDGELNENKYILKVGGQVIPVSEGVWSI